MNIHRKTLRHSCRMFRPAHRSGPVGEEYGLQHAAGQWAACADQGSL